MPEYTGESEGINGVRLCIDAMRRKNFHGYLLFDSGHVVDLLFGDRIRTLFRLR